MKRQYIKFSQKKFNNVIFLSWLALLISFDIFSQQLPHYTQYAYNMQIINPAFVGTRAELSMSMLSRQQWVGVEGAPKTQTFSINGRLRRGLGVGTTFINDKIGLSETNNVNLDVSYTLITSQFSRLSFGLKGGMTFFTNRFSEAITPDNDFYNSTSGNFPNVGFGAFFYNQNFYVGFSIPYLFESPQFYINDTNEIKLSKNPNYFLTSGILYTISEEVILKPSTMIRYTKNAPLSVDLNANLYYKNIIDVGLSYRHQNSVSALFALILNKKYRVGYAYDHKLDFIGGNFDTHEIIFHIDINLKRNSHWLLSNQCYF